MKLVSESINFEMGQEPKKSMDIGQTYVWKNLIPGNILEIKNTLIINPIDRRLKNSSVFSELDDIISKGYLLITGIIYNESLIEIHYKYFKNFGENYSEFLEDGYFYTEDINILPQKFNLLSTNDLKRLLNVDETLHFERRQEPKKSMDIGINYSNPFQKESGAWNVIEYMKEHHLSPNSILGKGLKKAAEMLKVPEEKILSAPDSNMEMSSSKIIKKEILNPNAKPGTDPITINLMENNYIYILNERYNQVLMILGTKY